MLNLFASALFDSRTAAIKANGGSHISTQPLEPELVEAVRAVWLGLVLGPWLGLGLGLGPWLRLGPWLGLGPRLGLGLG